MKKGGWNFFGFDIETSLPCYIYPKVVQQKMECFRMYVNRYQTALTCFDIETYTLFLNT